MMRAVELTVRDTNGAIMTVTVSTHRNIRESWAAARRIAHQYAQRYGFEHVEDTGRYWCIAPASVDGSPVMANVHYSEER